MHENLHLRPENADFSKNVSLAAHPIEPIMRSMKNCSSPSVIAAMESRLLEAAIPHIKASGFNEATINAARQSCDITAGELALILPNGTSDLAVLLWNSHDRLLDNIQFVNSLIGLKIREKIATLLNGRLDEAFKDEVLAKRLIGFLALPQNIALAHRLSWQTSDVIWRLAGDQALDENHYSKRIIVSAILSTAAISRLSRGREAQLEQIERNIAQVMAFEKFKAQLPTSPESMVTDILGFLGGLRFGRPVASND